jgi:hypothetical protein
MYLHPYTYTFNLIYFASQQQWKSKIIVINLFHNLRFEISKQKVKICVYAARPIWAMKPFIYAYKDLQQMQKSATTGHAENWELKSS